jgi:hypothetical protein
MTEFHSGLVKRIESKFPKEFLPDHSIGDKILLILDVWNDMRKNQEVQQEKLLGAMKDLEYTLNLLNVAESNLGDEHDELKKRINDWLDYYRNISKQEE